MYYGYDETVRLTEMKIGDEILTYKYDEIGRLAEKRFPNGTSSLYRYDAKSQIMELCHRDRKGVLDRYTYQYDLVGNKTEIAKERRGLAGESGVYRYGYDALGRLTEAARDGKFLRRYGYDAFGNRVCKEEGKSVTTYTHNALNQLVRETVSGTEPQEKRYRYDRRGNLTEVMKNGQVINQYIYGAMNRLEWAAGKEGRSARYEYNGLGYRTGKQEYRIDLTREYHNLLEKAEGEQNQKYYWDGNVSVYEEDGKKGYYLQDELGSPLRIGDLEGLLETYGYDEFGQDLYGNQGQVQPFGYTGYQTDSVAGTYFAQAREYRPEVGRFQGVDVIPGIMAIPITQNRYSYCFNSPMILVDWDGAWPSLSDIGNGIKKFGEKVVSGTKKIVNQTVDVIKAVPWKQIGIIAVSAIAVTAVTIGTAGTGTVGLALCGATMGAAVGVSTRAATDIALGQDSSWQEYLADGIGGAAAGTVAALAPGISGVYLGAISSGTSSLTGSILNGDSLGETAAKFALNTTFGAMAGGVGDFIGTKLKGTQIAEYIRELNRCGFNNLNNQGARGRQALFRILSTWTVYKTPAALYSMLTQETFDVINDKLAECIE